MAKAKQDAVNTEPVNNNAVHWDAVYTEPTGVDQNLNAVNTESEADADADEFFLRWTKEAEAILGLDAVNTEPALNDAAYSDAVYTEPTGDDQNLNAVNTESDAWELALAKKVFDEIEAAEVS